MFGGTLNLAQLNMCLLARVLGARLACIDVNSGRQEGNVPRNMGHTHTHRFNLHKVAYFMFAVIYHSEL